MEFVLHGFFLHWEERYPNTRRTRIIRVSNATGTPAQDAPIEWSAMKWNRRRTP